MLSKEKPAHGFSTSTILTGASILFSAGAIYGYKRQNESAKQEKITSHVRSTQQSVSLEASWLQKRLGLDRPLTPGSAALRSMLGGTIVSVVGCSIAFLCIIKIGFSNLKSISKAEDDTKKIIRDLGSLINESEPDR